jgi:Protein of unknown function (DUF4199)
MKRTVLTFGLISGVILGAMLLGTAPFHETIGFDRAEVIGYTSMIVAFLLIFFGVKSYRDNVAGGRIGFGRALAVGVLITVVSSACYVAAWEVVYFGLVPDFGEKYAAHLLEKAKADGATAEALERQRAEHARFAELYRNPAINVAITFLEPLPVGLVMALVSAGVLRRRGPLGP